ncbi:hypothetical protein QUF76_16785 [Desulfobacterales bacterium HSG16]|nr:hypothetical protein [Desulfobacterales bacterium HSG16]
MRKTTKRLKRAFIGESVTDNSTPAFPKQGKKNSFFKIAEHLKTAVKTKPAHFSFTNSKKVMRAEENRTGSFVATGSLTFVGGLYPVRPTAEAEGNRLSSADSVVFPGETENTCIQMYDDYSKDPNIRQNEYLQTEGYPDIFTCGHCGYTCKNERPESCPICKARPNAFFRVE